MRCRSGAWPRRRPINGSPKPLRIELYGGRGRKEGTAATQSETCIPNGSPGGKRVPESALRLGRSFRMAPQAETTIRNRAVEWDMLSQWQLKRKVHPGILIRNGMQFPNEWLAENSSQNRPSDWDVLSPGQLMLWGWLDRHALLNSKTCALSISKLGRRKPKRNRRRSI